MAAKQGLTAKIHQYSEDTKSSLLSRVGYSNLNTTCTIKSAPPRTPEVMSMLGTKCGWLAKRNEQRVWQKRWCVVVPHTFLYYFEASPANTKDAAQQDQDQNENNSDDNYDNNMHTYEVWNGGGINTNNNNANNLFINLDQDALNNAVKDMSGGGGNNNNNGGGMGGIGIIAGEENNMVTWDPEQQHNHTSNSPTTTTQTLASIGHHPQYDGIGGQTNAVDAAAHTNTNNNAAPYKFVSSSNNLQPVGIIDLECYASVNRSASNPTVIELAGDSISNPDLRSFYFQSASVEDADSWIRALLCDRHQSLKDETEAYKQVCDSFPLQLANCAEMIDTAEAATEAMERELYTVRCASEEGRRKVVNAVREMLERKCWDYMGSSTKRNKSGKGVGGDKSSSSSPGRKGIEQRVQKGTTKSPLLFGGDGLAVGGGKRFFVPPGSNTSNNDMNLGGEDGGGKRTIDSVFIAHYDKLESDRAALLRDFDTMLASPSSLALSNVLPPVQTLMDYTSTIIASFSDLRLQIQKYEQDLRTTATQDQSQVKELQNTIDGRTAQLADVERKFATIASDLKADLDASQQQVDELAKQLEAQRMEFGMYQNSTKTKLGELQQHKKILKKEVVELRTKIENTDNENITLAQEYEKLKSSYQSMKDKNATLERYIDRLEKQVGVQQNMMEMMSLSGAASLVGKVIGPEETHNDSKDAISLSGLSQCSLNRRQSSGGGGSKSFSYTPTKPPRLPPTSRDVSPIPVFHDMKNHSQVENEVAGTKVDRDISSAAYCNTDVTSTDFDSSMSDPTVPKFHFTIAADEKSDNSSMFRGVTMTSAAGLPPKDPNYMNNDACNGQHLRSDSMDQLLDVNASNSGLNQSLSADPTEMAGAVSEDQEEDDDVDDNCSDITEDRTQRQIDDDLAERRKILLAYVNQQHNKTEIVGSSNELSSNDASTQRRLETIEKMLPPPPPQGDNVECHSNETLGSNGSTGRLSVAQRARLDAESRSNVHRSPSPARPQRKSDTPESSSSVSAVPHTPQTRDDSISVRSGNSATTNLSRSDTIGRSGSFFKNIGKAIEKAVDNSVLGVAIDMANSESSDDETQSDVQSSVVSSVQQSSVVSKASVSFCRKNMLCFIYEFLLFLLRCLLLRCVSLAYTHCSPPVCDTL
jgi:predicted nuclease with TOPRIM domain